MAIDWSDSLDKIGDLHAARRRTRSYNRSVQLLVGARARQERNQAKRSKWTSSGKKRR